MILFENKRFGIPLKFLKSSFVYSIANKPGLFNFFLSETEACVMIDIPASIGEPLV